MTWKASPRQALSLTVYGETRSPNIERDRGEGKHRKAIHHQPATASRRQPAGHSAEPASPHGPHSPCAPAPAGRQRETEADLVLPAPHSRPPLPAPVSPQRASSRLLPVDRGWLKAGPVCGRESGRREPGRRARPEPAPRGHGAAPAAAAAKLALASREPASGGRRLTERI